MNPFMFEPKRLASAFILTAFAIVACFYLTGCETVPYAINAKYKGVKVGYDGRIATVDADVDALIDGFKK